jgi:hypothetical protein
VCTRHHPTPLNTNMSQRNGVQKWSTSMLDLLNPLPALESQNLLTSSIFRENVQRQFLRSILQHTYLPKDDPASFDPRRGWPSLVRHEQGYPAASSLAPATSPEFTNLSLQTSEFLQPSTINSLPANSRHSSTLHPFAEKALIQSFSFTFT